MDDRASAVSSALSLGFGLQVNVLACVPQAHEPIAECARPCCLASGVAPTAWLVSESGRLSSAVGQSVAKPVLFTSGLWACWSVKVEMYVPGA